MKTTARIAATLLIISSFNLATQSAFAETDYPTRPITYLVGYPPGGPSDLLARALATNVEKILKQPVVVQNKPGASASLQTALLAQAKPDGYTLGMFGSTATVVMPHVQKVAYDPLKDFTLIVNAFNFVAALAVRADAPWRTLGEFLDHAKRNPGTVKYGTYGAHGITTLVMGGLGKQLEIRWDAVPFKSDADAVAGLLGGHITAAASVSVYAQHAKAGKLRILALMSHKRSPELPGVPTLRESGYDFVAEGFQGVGGPKGLAQPVVKRLEAAFTTAMKGENYQELLKKLTFVEDYKDSLEFTRFVADSFHRHGALIRQLGLTPQGQ